jgi:hypothetical protein
MTSCPDEADVVLLLDDSADAAGPKAEAVIAHLAECEACRLLLARSEASLRAALGGLTDADAAVVTSAAPAADDAGADAGAVAHGPLPRVLTLRRFAAAAAVVAAAVVGFAFARRDAAATGPGRETATAPGATQTPAPRTALPRTALPRTVEEEMRHLLAEAARLADAPAPGEESDEIALAALAAAEARIELGVPTGAARLRDVVERFPGTPEAREARARLASLGEPR